ncbi:MAG: glycosyltransferase family 4 protein [Candidatus Riflebacteria bacterium]|nr:glycosyltransferase family 4 protein [Candidatus Riflebacteria bacterium]
MRITLLHGGCFPVPPHLGGAVEKVWFTLGQEFARTGNHVVQISRFFKDLPRREFLKGVEHRRVKGYDRPSSFTSLLVNEFFYCLRAMTALPSADILVTNSIWAPVLARKSRWGALYVHVARFPKGQMHLYRHVARLHSVSHAVAKAIARECREVADKVCVIPYPHGQDGLVKDIPTWESRENRILYVGRVHPEKGLELLINGFRHFIDLREKSKLSTPAGNQPQTPWNLVIVGPVADSGGGGGEPFLCRLQQLAQGLETRILFLPPIFDPGSLARLYQQSKLFIYPSIAETGEAFGLAPLEAMAHACPPVVSNLDCFKDFITPEENGFCFDHRCQRPERVLGELLHRICSEQGVCLSEISKKSFSTAQRYSIKQISQEYLQDFDRVLSFRYVKS